jgi:hypothetical protein
VAQFVTLSPFTIVVAGLLMGVGLKVLLMPKVGQAMETQASQALLKIITTAFTTLQILQKNFFLKVTPR